MTALGLTNGTLIAAVAFFLVSLAASTAIAAFVIVRLPSDYLIDAAPKSLFPGRPRWQQIALHLGKHVIGVALVVVGLVLSVPGVPGQGVLTVLTGVMLIDFPGKRRLEAWMLRPPRVLAALNRLRARFGKEPLESPRALES